MGLGTLGMGGVREEPVRPVKRLPSPREYALMGFYARMEVLAELQSIKLAYLNTEEIHTNRRGNDATETTERGPVSKPGNAARRH